MILVLLTLLTGGLGIWSVLRSWRLQVETQLRLNRCVARAASDLRQHLDLLETTNSSIRGLRASVRAAQVSLQVELVTPLLGQIEVVAAIQQADRTRWKVRANVWTLRGCGAWGDQVAPLPEVELSRGLRDDLGQQPLEWIGEKPSEFWIEAAHRPRSAAARVASRKSPHLSSLLPVAWFAEWALPRSPGGLPRAGSRAGLF